MEFEDDAFILSARSFGETGAIVEVITRAWARDNTPSASAWATAG